MTWNQSSPLQLESKIIHGTFSRAEKNVNHIVSGVLLWHISVVPHPPTQFLELAQAKQIMDQYHLIWASVAQTHHYAPGLLEQVKS